ncbi:MAG: FAD-binding oxidoreductase, partial [Bauldia sp.]|nr:FAD-binding oxidoreductase [Bauldia sp.]
MIPRLTDPSPVAPLYRTFLDELSVYGFKGEISSMSADRTAQATDNSIYQIKPEAVVFPRDRVDLVLVARLAAERRFREIKLAPRGGGTGTNGQSLTNGIMVDLSRHMNRIIEINPAKRWARVEPGVVKDELNAAIVVHGLFFAPETSTSDRATIGGMISTDASGQGSCRYGKTRNHVLELTSVLLGGTVWQSHSLEESECTPARAVGDHRCGREDARRRPMRLVRRALR